MQAKITNKAKKYFQGLPALRRIRPGDRREGLANLGAGVRRDASRWQRLVVFAAAQNVSLPDGKSFTTSSGHGKFGDQIVLTAFESRLGVADIVGTGVSYSWLSIS